jgi:hypothetical protein
MALSVLTPAETRFLSGRPTTPQDDPSEMSRAARLLLRDQLNVVLGFAELLCDDAGLTQRHRRFAGNILAAAAVLKQVVEAAAASHERAYPDQANA